MTRSRPPTVCALIVAGGMGIRLGGEPKQYRALAGVPILRRAVVSFVSHPGVSLVRVVLGEGQQADYSHAIAGINILPPVVGGATRQESVYKGLRSLLEITPDWVLIHDAARPLLSAPLITRVMEKLEDGAEAVLPLLPVPDSLRKWHDHGVGEAVHREGVCRAQTPQGFVFDKIHAAHERFRGTNATDDIALAEKAGLNIVAVMGDEINFKITTPADFAMAERLLRSDGDIRTGSGFDVHRFVPGEHLWLCGVRIPHDQALAGHSDADAGLHALTDAILGALAAGDIGQHFPPSDERWRGTASRAFVQHAAEMVKQRGGTILHCDVTIICEAPKIGPHRDAMRNALAEILGLDVSRISIKATTTEGLGFTGRGEGLAAQATATIRLPT